MGARFAKKTKTNRPGIDCCGTFSSRFMAPKPQPSFSLRARRGSFPRRNHCARDRKIIYHNRRTSVRGFFSLLMRAVESFKAHSSGSREGKNINSRIIESMFELYVCGQREHLENAANFVRSSRTNSECSGAVAYSKKNPHPML